MKHEHGHEEEDDRDCGCPRHRIRRLARWWDHVVHVAIHPMSAIIVMGAAAVEVAEWISHAVAHAWHLIGPVVAATGGGH